MKYTDVVQHIYTLIAEDNLAPGAQLPSENELIEKLNVSRITVRRAYQELIGSGIVERVRGSGTYLKNLPGSVNSSVRLPVYIPMVLPDAQNDSRISEFIRGAEKFLRTYSCFLTVHFTDFNPAEERNIIQDLVNRGSKYLIIYPCSSVVNQAFYFHLIEQGISLIFIDRKPQDLACHLVRADNYYGGYLAGTHLASKGCKNLAFFCIGEEDSVTSLPERIKGFQFAAKEAGISCQLSPASIKNQEDLERTLHGFLSQSDPVDGLFCLNDASAIPAMDYLLSKGYQIPRDLAVVSFDNLPFAENYIVPLTDVVQPYFDIGFQAASLAYGCIEGKIDHFQTRVLPVSLIARQSSRRDGLI